MIYVLSHKKIFTIFILFVFALFQIFFVPFSAHAILPIALTAEAIAIGAGLLTAAGITFATNESARAAGYRFVSGLGDHLRGLIDDAALLGGLLSITPDLWKATTDGASSFSEGQVDSLVLGDSATYQTSSSTSIPLGTAYGEISLILNGISGSPIASISLPTGLGSIQCAKIWDSPYNGDYVRLTYRNTNVTPSITYNFDPVYGSSIAYSQVSLYSDKSFVSILVDGEFVYSSNIDFSFLNKSITIGGVSTTQVSFTTPYSDVITANNYDIDYNYYGNYANDLSNRQATFPTTLDGVVGQSPSTVYEDAGAITVPPGAADNTEVGWLSALWAALMSLLASIADIPGNVADSIQGRFPQLPPGVVMFFPNILALILALMGLFAKGLIFLLDIYNIPPSTAMLNENIIQGINWARNLSFNGISLYSLIMVACNLMLGLLVFKLIKKIVLSIGEV